MNNNLKFRAYDTKRKQWCFGYETLGGFSLIGEVVLMGELNRYPLEELCDTIKFMQWTGLQDKNEKDIYEGDIIKFHYFYETFGEDFGVMEAEHELVGVVKWGEFGWAISAIKGEHWCGHTGFGEGEGWSNIMELCAMNEAPHEESFEIIGNIYENPNLLNQ